MEWPSTGSGWWNVIGALAGWAGFFATIVVAYLVYRATKRAERARRRDELFELIEKTRDPKYLRLLVDEGRALLTWHRPTHPPWTAKILCVSYECPDGWISRSIWRRLRPPSWRGEVIEWRKPRRSGGSDWLKFDEWSGDRDRVQLERLYRSNPVSPVIRLGDELHAPEYHHWEILQAAIETFDSLTPDGMETGWYHPGFVDELAMMGAGAGSDVTPLADHILGGGYEWAGLAETIRRFLDVLSGECAYHDMIRYFLNQTHPIFNDLHSDKRFACLAGVVASICDVAGPGTPGDLTCGDGLVSWRANSAMLRATLDEDWFKDRGQLEASLLPFSRWLNVGKPPKPFPGYDPRPIHMLDGLVDGMREDFDAVDFVLAASVCVLGILAVDAANGEDDWYNAATHAEWVLSRLSELPPCTSEKRPLELLIYQIYGVELLLRAADEDRWSMLSEEERELEIDSIVDGLWQTSKPSPPVPAPVGGFGSQGDRHNGLRSKMRSFLVRPALHRLRSFIRLVRGIR